jgi:tRNA A37 N6-isopentenylltransferase MiaA
MDEAIRLIKKETRRFIRQQYNWFRLDDPSVHWFDASGDFYGGLCDMVKGFLTAADAMV